MRSDNPHSYGVRAMKCDGTTAISTYRDRPAHDNSGAVVTLATDVVDVTCWRVRAYSQYGTQSNLYGETIS
jgi:hypothetical protein